MTGTRVRLVLSMLVWDSFAMAAAVLVWRCQHSGGAHFMPLFSLMVLLSFYLVALAVARGGAHLLLLLPLLLPFAWVVAPAFLAWFAIRDTWCCVGEWHAAGQCRRFPEGVRA